MVLYFSGTGNSRYAAERLAGALGEELLALAPRLRAQDTAAVGTGARLVIVTPTYAWRIPRIVRDWLLRTPLRGAKQVWFVMTCGSEIGNAAKYNRALSAALGLQYMGTAQIVMPENYIAMFPVPDAEEARRIVAAAEPALARAAAAIVAGAEFRAPRRNLYDRFMSGTVNPLFYAAVVKARAFAAGDACTGCGMCVRLCPLRNIRLEQGKPVWDKACTHCMACICSCPAEAIEYGRRSAGKPRYRFEALGIGAHTDDG